MAIADAEKVGDEANGGVVADILVFYVEERIVIFS